MANDALKKLLQILIDTRYGYEKAVDETADADISNLFTSIVRQRAADEEAIHAMLLSEGETPDDSGSLMATVHRTVVAARTATLGLDKDALPAFVSGEQHVLDAYDEALREQLSQADVATLLREQKTNALAKVREMQRMSL